MYESSLRTLWLRLWYETHLRRVLETSPVEQEAAYKIRQAVTGTRLRRGGVGMLLLRRGLQLAEPRRSEGHEAEHCLHGSHQDQRSTSAFAVRLLEPTLYMRSRGQELPYTQGRGTFVSYRLDGRQHRYDNTEGRQVEAPALQLPSMSAVADGIRTLARSVRAAPQRPFLVAVLPIVVVFSTIFFPFMS